VGEALEGKKTPAKTPDEVALDPSAQAFLLLE
jgi:hypothetical protein